MTKRNLYSFYWDCGRMGSLEGLFVAYEQDVVDVIGKSVDFGEALGKHSEVCDIIEEKDISMLSNDQEKVEWLVSIIGDTTISGWNPLNYIIEEEEEEEEE